MNLTLRRATAADVETLFDIRTSVTQNHLSREQMAELGITADILTEAMSEPCAWIAHKDGMPAGFAMVDLESAELFALFVRPAFEGLGLGRLLLEAAEASLFQRHSRIWLVTDGGEHIRANGFYRSMGWQWVDRLDERDVRYEKLRT